MTPQQLPVNGGGGEHGAPLAEGAALDADDDPGRTRIWVDDPVNVATSMRHFLTIAI